MTGTLRAFLVITGGLLLGLSYPPFETGMLAAAGFVPLLILLSAAESYGQAFRASYATFFLFNAITLYWPGGFTHGKDAYLMISGALLIVAHPLFMSLPILVWHTVRRSIGFFRSVLIFPVVWVAFEYAHSATQLSFPWLTLGNTQTYDPEVVQAAGITGVYGLSFWLLCLNVLFFMLFTAAGDPARRGTGRARAFLLVALIVLFYFAPYAASRWLVAPWDGRGEKRLALTAIQPDIDPFEKWEGENDPQVALLKTLTDSAVLRGGGGTDLVVWPETAIPFYLLSPANAAAYRSLREYVDSGGVPLLTGIPDIIFYPDGGAAPGGARSLEDGTRYETFNSSMLLVPGSDVTQKYAKALLVPFAERVPYSDALGFLNAARWNFGLGGWSPGRDTALFRLPVAGGDTVRFGNLICYESVYPGYVADLVRRGAGFLTVITNDSWWGNTSGPYQHRQFAVLRAVENRRWIVQCANGGISFAVDPSGRIVSETGLFTRTALRAEIGVPSALTPYTRHGDWFAEACLVLTLFVFSAAVFHRMVRNKMERA